MRTWILGLVVIASTGTVNHGFALGSGDVGCANATVVSVGSLPDQQTSGHWPSGGPPSSIFHDVDWYRFTVQPGQRMDVDLTATQVTASGPHYIFMRLNEFDPAVCPGAAVEVSFAMHVAAVNHTAVPKQYVMQLYAGVTNPGDSVVVTYDVTLQATSVQTAVTYCPGAPNSLGIPGTLTASGTNSVTANDLVFQGAQLPPSTTALLAMGTTSTQAPFGDGFRCIAGSVRRLHTAPVSAASTWSFALDIQSLPPGGAITPGALRYFQLHYRNPAGPLGTGFNLTNGLAVTFVP